MSDTPGVSLTRSLAGSAEIRAYLIDQLNLALRRPGMFGRGEGPLRMLIDHLLFVENQPDAWAEQQRAWEARGAMTNIGVAGAFCDLIPGSGPGDPDQHCVASVYAEFAYRRGWLGPDRLLPADEHHALRTGVRQWAETDRVWADVVDEFGSPSILFGGTSPLYSKTLGYLSEDPDEPMVFFHLWNGGAPEAESSWPPEHEEPALLAVRFGGAAGGGPFGESFVFTPEGQRRKGLR
ncbi:hypothetical protein ACWCOZ_34565 [Streptomyces sp. NPDC001840]